MKTNVQIKKCVVLANGPSLNDTIKNHNNFLLDKDLMCVNTFPNTDYYTQFKPKYVIIGAPEFWIDTVDDIYIKMRDELYSNLVSKTTWPIHFIVPTQASKKQFWKDIINQNKNITIDYYNMAPIDGWKWFCHLVFSLQLGMPRPHNILTPAIYTSIVMGYKDIYLWGADHSWLKEISVDDNNTALVNQKHFYDNDTAKPQHMRKSGVGARKLHEILHKFMHAFASYFALRFYAESKGARIINNTPDSFIDAFEREKLK